MDAGAVIVCAAILLIVALLLQLLWYIAIAALLWIPPTFAAIVAGWYAYQCSGSVMLSFGISVVSQRLVLISMHRAFAAIHLFQGLLLSA